MNPPSFRRPRAIPTLLGLGLVAASTLGLTSIATPAIAAEAPVQIVLAPSGGGVLQPGADLTITAALTNIGQSALDGGTLNVALDREVIDTRAGLSEWLSPADASGNVDDDAIVATVTVPSLPPGHEQLVAATIPAAQLTLDGWGVRGISASLTLDSKDKATARSSVVINSGAAPAPVSVAVAIPLTTQAGQTGLIPAATLATITSNDGLLTRELDAVLNRPVGIMLDPRIIASIRALGTTAPESATAWLDRLASASNPIYPLSYADADLSAMSQAGAAQVLAPSSFAYALDKANFVDLPPPTETPKPSTARLQPGSSDSTTTTPTTPAPEPTPTPTPSPVPSLEQLLDWNYSSTSLAWPRDDTSVATDLPFFAASGLSSTILSSSNVSFPDDAAPAGVARSGDSTVLVSDDTVSRALREAAGALTPTERQRSLSDLASGLAVVADSGGSATPILATFDRSAPSDGNTLSDALSTIEQLPWASPLPFDSLLTQTPSVNATVIDSREAPDRIAQVASLLGSENQVAAFSSVLTDPAPLLGQNRADLLSLLANSWAPNTGGWSVAVQSRAEEVAKTLAGVSIVAGSPITLLGNTADMPVLVQNTLPYPVNVTLRLSPSNFRLVVEDQVTITVEARSSKQARVPIKSGVANGDTTVRVELVSPTGVLITPEPTYIPVNVSADWEVAGTWLVSSVVALLLVVAAFRLIRQRRRSQGAEMSVDADDAAGTAGAAGKDGAVGENKTKGQDV